MAKRSVHLSEQAEAIIAFLSDAKKNGGSNYSGSINSMLELVSNIAKSSKPELSEDEWVYLCNVYSGCEIGFVMPIRIASDIMDDAGCSDVEHIDPVGRSLIKQADKWSQCEQLAVLWEVKTRWQAK